MPYLTLIPVGELLNHDNVQTYYIYQRNDEKPDASDRYSGIIDNKDHDEDLHDTSNLFNLKLESIFKLNFETTQEKNMENCLGLQQIIQEVDAIEKAESNV